ncbi:MAG: C39 family peptidase [Eubacteriales bacterium]|nr:C39 family peptidase [Eubacteriales bacterium]
MKRFYKKACCLLFASLFVLALMPAAALAAPLGDVREANLIKITSAQAFKKGTLENLVVDETAGDGALRLGDGAAEGTYISEEIAVPAFEYLVASWNADTPPGTYVEVFGRAYVDKKEAWSSWLSWGKWSPYIERASTNDEDELAMVDVDTFTVLGTSGETANRFQFKVVLASTESGVSPVLRQVAASMKNTLKDQGIGVYHQGVELPEKVLLDTPAYSQMVRDRAIADSICSPTTMTMLLNDRGEDLFPEEVALNEYDFEYEGFGNWSYTVAAAGMYGYDAYCMYADFDFLREQLALGYSVGISVKYSNKENGSNPYLQNGAISSTSGHLISIVGYETIDGVDYFYSNDSAAGTDELCVLRKYKAKQLDYAWSNRLAYIVGDKEQGAGFAAPKRVDAALSYVEGSENEYALAANGSAVALSKSFLSGKLRQLGNGSIFVIRKTDAALPVFNDVTVCTTANLDIEYPVKMSDAGNIILDPGKVLKDDPEGAIVDLTVYVVFNNGVTYVAPLTLTKARAVPGATAAPAAQTSAATAAPAKETEAPAKPGGIAVYIAIAAAVVVAGTAFLILTRGKKRG